MKYVQILTSRPVGQKCIKWAEKNIPEDWALVEAHDVPSDEADVIISVLYAHILKAEQIKGKRVYNFHPGILPEYAGSATFPWAIMNGEREAGITLHEIVPEVDAGDVIEIRKFPIEEDETGDTLWAKAEGTFKWMFEDWFEKLVSGAPIIMTEQNMKKRRVYTRKDLENVKDIGGIVRALTFEDKESAYFVNADNVRINVKFSSIL